MWLAWEGRRKSLHWRELQRRRCHQRIESLQLFTQGVFVFFKRDKLLKRIMPEFLSMEFHKRGRWEAGRFEPLELQLLGPASEKSIRLGRAPPTHSQCAVSRQDISSAQHTKCELFSCAQLARPFSWSQLPGAAHAKRPRPQMNIQDCLVLRVWRIQASKRIRKTAGAPW